MKGNIRRLILRLWKFELMQYTFGRKYMGGIFYYQIFGIPVLPFWSDTIIESCQGTIIKTEKYDEK